MAEKIQLPSWARPEKLDVGPASPLLIIISILAICLPLIGWFQWELASRPLIEVLKDPGGFSWATFAVLWSILGRHPDIRILFIPLLISWCWGAGDGHGNLKLLLPHLLWCLSVLSLQKAEWFRVLGLWISLDALWFWYLPFMFPGATWTTLGPITLALRQDDGISQLWTGIGISLAFAILAMVRIYFKNSGRNA